VTVDLRQTGDHTDADVVAESVLRPPGFAALFDRHAAAIRRYAAARVGPDTAEDVLAQTFLIAFERRASYDRSRASARPWLFGIASRLIQERRRHERRTYLALARMAPDRPAPPVADRAAERADAAAVANVLMAAVARMPMRYREVLLLYAWADLSYEEIAEALDIPVGTVASARPALPRRRRGRSTGQRTGRSSGPAWRNGRTRAEASSPDCPGTHTNSSIGPGTTATTGTTRPPRSPGRYSASSSCCNAATCRRTCRRLCSGRRRWYRA
jgi:RNA polymerase sigma factor (sigma-70 family)